jgi:hypothetical protein
MGAPAVRLQGVANSTPGEDGIFKVTALAFAGGGRKLDA